MIVFIHPPSPYQTSSGQRPIQEVNIISKIQVQITAIICRAVAVHKYLVAKSATVIPSNYDSYKLIRVKCDTIEASK